MNLLNIKTDEAQRESKDFEPLVLYIKNISDSDSELVYLFGSPEGIENPENIIIKSGNDGISYEQILENLKSGVVDTIQRTYIISIDHISAEKIFPEDMGYIDYCSRHDSEIVLTREFPMIDPYQQQIDRMISDNEFEIKKGNFISFTLKAWTRMSIRLYRIRPKNDFTPIEGTEIKPENVNAEEVPAGGFMKESTDIPVDPISEPTKPAPYTQSEPEVTSAPASETGSPDASIVAESKP